MKKISFKIIMSVTLCLILTVTIISSVFFIQAQKSITKLSNEKFSQIVNSQSNYLDSKILTVQTSVNNLADVLLEQLKNVKRFKKDHKYQVAYQNTIESISYKFAKNTPGAVSFYVRFNPKFAPGKSGIFYLDTNNDNKFEKLVPTDFSQYDPKDVAHVGWYYVPINKGKPTWMNPYYNSNVNMNMISYVIPLYKDNETIGIVGMDIDTKLFKKAVQSIKLGNTGYAYMIDANFNFVAHKKYTYKDNLAKIDNGSLKSVVNKMKNRRQGTIEYKLNGENKVAVYKKMRNGLTIVITTDKKELFGDIDKIGNIIVILAIIILLICIFTSYYIANAIIAKPLNLLKASTEKFANYDFSNNIADELKEKKDEIGEIANSVDKMQKSLKNLINEIASNSNLIQETSQSISASTKEMADTTETQATSIKEFSATMEEVAKGVDYTSDSIQDVAQEINNITNQLNKFSEEVNNTIDSSNSGKMIMDKTVQEFETTYTTSKKFINLIGELNSESMAIKNIAETINSISEQTNLLALNAAIEAARAGEMGKGFGVVSDEIRKLSEETKVSIGEINNTVRKIEAKISEVESGSNVLVDSIDNSNKLIEEAKNKFGDIHKNVDIINVAGIQINQGVNLINNNIGNISATVEQQAASIEEIVTSADVIRDGINQVSAGSEEIARSTNDMSSESEKLVELVNKFKI